MPQQFGYLNDLTPPRPRSGLAAAAASKDPYGLAPNNRSGPLGIGAATGFAAPPKTPVSGVAPSIGGPSPDARAGVGGSYPKQPAVVVQPQAPPTAATVDKYDLSTDPGLQQVQSLVGLSDQQAQSGALKQREDLLLAYGDPNVASSVLGADDPIVQAAGQNPTGTVQQLGQQKDRNLKTLDDQLNAANLGYSGYRVTQETQAGQDYQNALAQAAGGLNQNLDAVTGNLNSALSADRATLAQAFSDAADRASTNAANTGTDPGAIDPSSLAAAAGGGAGGTAGGTPSAIDPVTQAIFNKGLQARQGFLNFGLRNSGML